MGKGNTVYEDRAEKEEKRKQRQQERLNRHIVTCPHCGKDVLDHMTKCPHCGGELTPLGYHPMQESTKKKLKIVGYTVGIVIAIAVVILVFTLKI